MAALCSTCSVCIVHFGDMYTAYLLCFTMHSSYVYLCTKCIYEVNISYLCQVVAMFMTCSVLSMCIVYV